MNFLVTGATGFVGPYLIRQLLAEGHSCRGLVRNLEKAKTLRDLDVEWVTGDITHPASIQGIADGMDGVFHLATLGHMDNFKVDESMFMAVNVNGTKAVMQEALRSGVERVIHCSSVAAMGICPEVPADENTPCNPHHPYGRSKLAAENAVRGMIKQNNLPALIVRFSMVYGPGDWRDMLKLTRMTKKGLFPKVGNRPKLTPLIHVKDAVQGLILAMEKGRIGETYLITNARSERFDDIRSILKNALGNKKPTLYVPERVALTAAATLEKLFTKMGKSPPVTRKNIESTLADRVFSIAKAQAELGFDPKINVEEGLTETVKWYLEKGWV